MDDVIFSTSLSLSRNPSHASASLMTLPRDLLFEALFEIDIWYSFHVESQ